jgi:hypothetical protein
VVVAEENMVGEAVLVDIEQILVDQQLHCHKEILIQQLLVQVAQGLVLLVVPVGTIHL